MLRGIAGIAKQDNFILSCALSSFHLRLFLKLQEKSVNFLGYCLTYKCSVIYMILISSMSRINYCAFFSFIHQTFPQSIMCLALCCQLGNLQDCKVPEGWIGANCLGHFYNQPTSHPTPSPIIQDHLTNAKGSFFNILLKSSVLCSVAQLCLTSCDPMDCSPPGSSIHGFSRQEYWNGLP